MVHIPPLARAAVTLEAPERNLRHRSNGRPPTDRKAIFQPQLTQAEDEVVVT